MYGIFENNSIKIVSIKLKFRPNGGKRKRERNKPFGLDPFHFILSIVNFEFDGKSENRTAVIHTYCLLTIRQTSKQTNQTPTTIQMEDPLSDFVFNFIFGFRIYF